MATGKQADCGGSCGGNCGCGGSGKEDPVWIDPSQYNLQVDGPSYLADVKVAKMPPEVAKEASVMARKASQVITPMVVTTMQGFKTSTTDPGVFKGLPLVDLLKVLHAVALVHHTCHWRTSGPQYYGDHLLFDRIYQDLLGHVDSVAERAIGLGSGVLVTADAIASGTLKVLECLGTLRKVDSADPATLATISLEAAKVALSAVEVVTGAMKAAGNLTDGTENLLQGLADKYEEHVYLLSQRLS